MTMDDRAQPLATAHTPAPENWFEAWQRQGLYLRYAIATTLIAGMYLLPVLVGLLIFAVRLRFSANAGAGAPHQARR
jgi:hypothetical protein